MEIMNSSVNRRLPAWATTDWMPVNGRAPPVAAMSANRIVHPVILWSPSFQLPCFRTWPEGLLRPPSADRCSDDLPPLLCTQSAKWPAVAADSRAVCPSGARRGCSGSVGHSGPCGGSFLLWPVAVMWPIVVNRHRRRTRCEWLSNHAPHAEPRERRQLALEK